MALPMNRLAQEAQRRAALTGRLAVSQRPVDTSASTGLAHLPEKYDRDAVQVALDDLVSMLNARIGQAGERG